MDPDIKGRIRLSWINGRLLSGYSRVFLLGWILMMSYCSESFGQASITERIRAADALFQSGKYQQALFSYEQIQQKAPDNARVFLKSGQSAFYIGEYEKAVNYIQSALDLDPDMNADALRYLGMSWHRNQAFDQAITAYKAFLARTKRGNPFREQVILQIKYCASGLRMQLQPGNAYVERLGSDLNSSFDDYAPVLSPTKENRVYFSSVRAKEQRDESHALGKSDIYQADQIDGQWQDTHPIPGFINSAAWERLEGFSHQGRRMYFFRGEDESFGHILVDTFGVEAEDYDDFDRFPNIIRPEMGDCGLFYFNDQTILFSSNRPGGQGGFDLYICQKSKEGWGAVHNLGPGVNSAYDESDPWLAADGRTLYFSSNRPSSVGGFDIFRTEYEDRMQRWESVTNLGLSVNSAADDRHFSLSEDGYSALFDSERKNGMQDRDIYAVYFNEQRREQTIVSFPAHFALVEDSTVRRTSPRTMTSTLPSDTQKVIISPLYFDEGDLLSSSNRERLDQLIGLLKEYPTVNLALESHSDFDGPVQLDMYFSAKRAEEVGEYVLLKGLDTSRLTVRATGNQYPMTSFSGGQQISGQFNRRIELQLYSGKQIPLRIEYRRKQPEPAQFTEEYHEYRTRLDGISFRVQITSQGGMYNHPLLKEYSDLAVEIDYSSKEGRYRYLIGLFDSYSESRALAADLREMGMGHSSVIPYLNGHRVNQESTRENALEYEEFKAYLEDQ